MADLTDLEKQVAELIRGWDTRLGREGTAREIIQLVRADERKKVNAEWINWLGAAGYVIVPDKEGDYLLNSDSEMPIRRADFDDPNRYAPKEIELNQEGGE